MLVLAHPLDSEGNDFPRHPLYVALVRESVAWLARWEKNDATHRTEPAGLAQPLPPGVHATESGLLEVTAAADESDVVPATLDEVRAAFGLNAPSAAGVPDSAAVTPGESLERPAELWPWLAGALFILLCGESILARHASKPAPSPLRT